MTRVVVFNDFCSSSSANWLNFGSHGFEDVNSTHSQDPNSWTIGKWVGIYDMMPSKDNGILRSDEGMYVGWVAIDGSGARCLGMASILSTHDNAFDWGSNRMSVRYHPCAGPHWWWGHKTSRFLYLYKLLLGASLIGSYIGWNRVTWYTFSVSFCLLATIPLAWFLHLNHFFFISHVHRNNQKRLPTLTQPSSCSIILL